MRCHSLAIWGRNGGFILMKYFDRSFRQITNVIHLCYDFYENINPSPICKKLDKLSWCNPWFRIVHKILYSWLRFVILDIQIPPCVSKQRYQMSTSYISQHQQFVRNLIERLQITSSIRLFESEFKKWICVESRLLLKWLWGTTAHRQRRFGNNSIRTKKYWEQSLSEGVNINRNLMNNILPVFTRWLALGVILVLLKSTIALSPSGENACSRKER